MKKFVCVLSVILALCSCTAERQPAKGTFVIDYDENESFDWDALVQVEEVIPLETNDSCLLSYADKCEFGKDKIVYLDGKQKALFVFDYNGKFLYKIDALGPGDKEYSMLKDAIISRDGQRILLLDNASILVFDLATGAYLDRWSLDESAAISFPRFAEGDGGRIYFWSTDSDNSLYVWNNDSLSVLKKRQGYPFVSRMLYRDDAGRANLISDYGQYTIEVIEGDSVLPKYTFDFGRWAFPTDMKIESSDDWTKAEDGPYFKSLLSVYETKDALYVNTASPQKKLYNIAVQKSTSKIVCGNQIAKAPVVVVASDEHSFYGILYPAYFDGDNPLSNLVREHHVAEDDNPVIIKFKFKFE